MPSFIDTHCHFDFPPFSDNSTDALALAEEAGIQGIIIPSVAVDNFNRVLHLSQQHNMLYAALGLHPLYIAQHQEHHLQQLSQRLASGDPRIVAVGEIGLDLYMPAPQLSRQCVLLQQQLALAKAFDLPVLLHSRRSHDQLARELRRANLPRCGVVHGFAGSLAQAQAFVKLGYAIGVGGTITYPRAQKTRAVMAELPLQSLLLETDAPDMPLMGYQGQVNRPERIVQIFETLCSLRREPPALIAETIWHNTQRFFPSVGSE